MDITNYELEPDPREVRGNNSSTEIYMCIKIGNGQIGGNKVSLNEQLLAKGNLTEPTFIGDSSSLSNKEIEIETNVLDVNPATNRCVITTTILDQDNKKLYSKMDRGVAPENGVASFKGKYKITFILLLAFFLFVGEQNIIAQSSSEEIEFNKLETPSSPGLILFDETPSSIEKPTTPQGFSIGLLELGQKGGALEVAPFWLYDHPNLTAKDMYTNNTPILSHLSLSFAAGKSDSLSFLSGGLRTRLFQSYGEKIQDLNSFKSNLEELLSDQILNKDKIDSLRNIYVKQAQNPIFTIDFAAALGGSSIENSFETLNLNRWATWLSLNWRPKGDDFYTTVLTRYINSESYENTDINADLFDLGTRFNYDISQVTISLEYIHRMNFTSDTFDDYRLAAIGSYQLTDNIFVTSTFGKNFSDVNNVIALAGLNFGFSQKKIKAY